MKDRTILLLVEHERNRQLLSQAIAAHYQILAPEAGTNFVEEGEQLLEEDFDLCFVDYTAIHYLRDKMMLRREAISLFLPFVFLTTVQNVGLSTDGLEPVIDDIIHLPIEKVELRTKIRVLLRSRSYSLQLNSTQELLNKALIKEQELNQIKSRFVSTVSHEFRNPLNSISGMTQVLEAYGDKLSPERKAEVLQQLRRNVMKMTNLLNDVLIVSQKDMNKLRFNSAPVMLEKFCRGVASEISTAFELITIDFTYKAEPQYNLDSSLLNCVLTNLLSNACKYSPNNSRVDFEVKSKDEELIFTICDRGIGIPADDLPYLFDSFYRASNSQDHQGSGLGLAIAKDYVELHRGTISVSSELKVGTTFTVTIPVNIEH